MKTLLAVDGNSILCRAFYGIRPLTTHTGLFTNAVYGFATILSKHIENLKPDALADRVRRQGADLQTRKV